MPVSTTDRFAAKTSMAASGCLIWNGAVDRNGHGVFWFGGRLVGAHRAAWALQYGALPTGSLLHSCDVRACVNVAHLSEGDQAVNIADMVSKGRQSRGEQRPNAVLTEHSVLVIRRDHAAGISMASLARRSGVHRTTIRDAITGRSWAGVA